MKPRQGERAGPRLLVVCPVSFPGWGVRLSPATPGTLLEAPSWWEGKDIDGARASLVAMAS